MCISFFFLGPIPPLTALDERNGISVLLHLAKDTPRPDVSVYVVSTISKNSSPLSNYVFQAVLPKVFFTCVPIWNAITYF